MQHSADLGLEWGWRLSVRTMVDASLVISQSYEVHPLDLACAARLDVWYGGAECGPEGISF